MPFRDDLRRAMEACRAVLVGVLMLGSAACETKPLTQTRTTPGGAVGGVAGSASVPPAKPLAADGEDCETDDDCEAGHCSHRICCTSGNCCRTEEDCPTSDGAAASCDEPETCQGSRGEVTCSKFRCRAKNGVEDDSGCDVKTEASDCGLYVSVFCNGEVDQEAPDCPTECVDDTACDSAAHCESGECVRDVPDGGECGSDVECASGHCNNGLCCKTGDCCREDTDCSEAQYGSAGTCDDLAHCQGHRSVPRCEDSQCGSALAEDDSACDRNVIANDCGDGPDVKCRGGAEQTEPPPCATGACGGFGGATCNEQAFCWQGQCLPDQPNGEGCTDNASCQSGHCQNNVCCSDGDCCENDTQCMAVRTCEDLLMCQGHRQDRYCDMNSGTCANGMLVEDDSGCANMQSERDCNRNVSPLCTMEVDQADAPACGRCTNVPVCTRFDPVIDPESGETTGYRCRQDGWVNVPAGCEGAARCDSLSGRCF